MVIKAPDLDEARRAAQEALEEREDGESRWSLGVLRPLTPKAPGTHRYLITFSQWEPHEDHFERRDVRVLELWAADGQSARRLAQQEIQRLPEYLPSWRIRSVSRDDGGGPPGR
ncbi:MAG: hypothetical protein ACR2N6_08355 [Miltoncostaeaceae bacterium]